MIDTRSTAPTHTKQPELGIFLPNLAGAGGTLGTGKRGAAAAGCHAEALGYGSVWVVDQLVAGTGTPILDSGLTLAAVASVTERVGLGYGVMILSLRPTVWAAKQISTLQQLSTNRVLLGVGVGGDRHRLTWAAAGVTSSERGRRTDHALDVLGGLIAGQPTDVDGVSVQLSPGVPVPPLLIGGTSDAAYRRIRRATAAWPAEVSWFGLPVGPDTLEPMLGRLHEVTVGSEHPPDPPTASVIVSLRDDLTAPTDDELIAALSDPDGKYAMPADAAATLPIREPDALRRRLDALGELGVDRVVVDVAGGDWFRQAELVAKASQGTRSGEN